MAYAALGRWQEAVKPYRQSSRLKPDFVEALYNLATAYHHLGHYEDEINTWKDAIRIKPDSALAANNLGVAFGKVGRYREEIKSCKQAVKIKPDLAVAHYNLAVSYLLQGDRHLARKEEKTLELLDSGLTQKLRNLTADQYTMRVGGASRLKGRSSADSLPSDFDRTTVTTIAGGVNFPITNETGKRGQADAVGPSGGLE